MTGVTFQKPVLLATGASFCLTQSAELFRKRPNGNQKDISVTLPTFNSGLGFMGQHIYVVDFGTAKRIWRWNIVEGTGGNWVNTPFDDPDDVTCDGTYIYLSGADTGDGGGSSDYRVAKFEADATPVWSKNLGAYGGGAIHISANSYGFMLVSDYACRVYDTEGALVANNDSNMIDNVGFPWASCATRDRFFAADKTASLNGTVKIYQYNSSTGARVQTITPTDLALDETGLISATEDHLFYWTNQGTEGRTNHHVRIYDRTVARDSNGEITSDTIATTGTNYDLGTTTTSDFTKAATNADTYTNY